MPRKEKPKKIYKKPMQYGFGTKWVQNCNTSLQIQDPTVSFFIILVHKFTEKQWLCPYHMGVVCLKPSNTCFKYSKPCFVKTHRIGETHDIQNAYNKYILQLWLVFVPKITEGKITTTKSTEGNQKETRTKPRAECIIIIQT